MQILLNELERDIRNQVLIDSLRRTKLTSSTLPLKEKTMILFRRHSLLLATLFLAIAWICFCIVYANADELPKYPCPTAEPCKILTLTQQEERLLTGQNGILDTAAQGRALELGGIAVYLKTRIASAPAGEPQKPAPAPTGPGIPVPDNPKPN